MKEFRYFRLGIYYVALHPNEMTVYTCSAVNPWYTFAKIEASASQYSDIEKNQVKESITAAEFQQHFSNAVEKLHNETPFA